MCCWAPVRSVRPEWCVCCLLGDAGPPRGQDRAGQGSGLEFLGSSGGAVREEDVKGGLGGGDEGPRCRPRSLGGDGRRPAAP